MTVRLPNWLSGLLLIIIFGVPAILIAGGVYFMSSNPYSYVYESYFLIGLVLLIIGLAYLSVVCAVIITSIKKDKKRKQAAALEEEHKLAKKQALCQQMQNGEWPFPSLSFYQLCVESKITDLESAFHANKARLVAQQLITKNAPEIEPVFFAGYLSIDSLKRFFAEGKARTLAADAERLMQQKQVTDASPGDKELTFMRRALKLSSLHGKEKRMTMLSDLYDDYDRKIHEIAAGEAALKQLGAIYMDQQKKESSWAIMGGIADGIAGPAAGLAAAASTMANNAKIRKHNAAIRNAAMDMMRGIPSLAGTRYELADERDRIPKEMESTEIKVVLSDPNELEIWKNIEIEDMSVKKNPSGVLAVSLTIAFVKPFELDVPDGVVMVVDGTIAGEVWFEDQLVGEVFFPLPLYGIPCNMTVEVTLDGMCGRSVEYDGEYTVKIADKQNLWIMEV